MKRKFIAVALMATLGVTTFMACNKKSIESSQSNVNGAQASKALTETGTTDAAANPNNSYDNVGYNHNMALQATRSVWTNASSTAQDDYNAMVEYSNSMGYPINMTYANVTSMVGNLNADNSIGKSNYVNTIGLSQQARSYAVQIFTIANQVYSYDSYDAFKNAMIQLESTISSDNTISSNDRGRLLSGASVARHSILYWARETSGYNSNPDTNGNPSGPVALSLWGNIRNWLKDHPVFTADLGGALGGIGSVAGAIFGAAGASLVAWAME